MKWANFAYETGPFHSDRGRCSPVFSVAPHLSRTQSDHETGPFHSDRGRCSPVFSVAPHLSRTQSDHDTGPFHSDRDGSNPELPKKRRRPKHKKFQLKELTVLVPADAGPVETIIDQILQGEQNGREIRTKDGHLVAYVDGIVQRFNKKAHEAHQKKLKQRGKMPIEEIF
uniref:Uncharacterized protein n=1 Tax=Timema cristinae TaxID=61476 RepID=A0A7R9H6Z7_TIMCR|nr:unnamed protein product [Timema cristinae]